jgi:hypothetical protein
MTHETIKTAVAAFTNIASDFGTAYRAYMATKPRPGGATGG